MNASSCSLASRYSMMPFSLSYCMVVPSLIHPPVKLSIPSCTMNRGLKQRPLSPRILIYLWLRSPVIETSSLILPSLLACRSLPTS